MNEFENQGGAKTNPEVEELRDELRVMRLLLTVAMVMLIALSLCADYYLSRQITGFRAQAKEFEQIADAFPQAAANDFVNRLKEYARTHPDFAPIATKYASVFNAPPAPAVKK